MINQSINYNSNPTHYNELVNTYGQHREVPQHNTVFPFTSAILHFYFIKVFKETKDRIIKKVKVLHNDKGQPVSNEKNEKSMYIILKPYMGWLSAGSSLPEHICCPIKANRVSKLQVPFFKCPLMVHWKPFPLQLLPYGTPHPEGPISSILQESS